jgi:phosphoglycerate dehydrogenase-like enzyme
MKPNGLFINVGRGSLIKSDELLKALDAKDGLFGAAIDVTDPEPLPAGHPLFTHPKCIVTPHLSGDTEGEFEITTDIAIANAERIRKGEEPYNLIDPRKGY